jgi:hypothetical protein
VAIKPEITYTWNISQLNCYPESEGQTNVVFTAHWTAYGDDGTFTGCSYGTASLTYVAGTPYTPFADLTLEQTVAWVKSALGEDQVISIESSIANQIESLHNPVVISPPLPWSVSL